VNVPICDDPLPEDLITPSRAATLLKMRPRTIYRRIERGQLRAWRDVDSGRLRVSQADVLAKWKRTLVRVPPREERRPAPVTVRERQQAEAEVEARRRFRLPV
jgi:excisionase family DNA binding protein